MNKREEWLEKLRCCKDVSEDNLDILNRASKVLTDNIILSDKEPFKSHKCIMPSPRTYRGIWNWDSAFHAIAVSRFDAELAKTQLSVFFDFQLENGLYPDVIFEDGNIVNKFGKPPVFPWSCVIVYKRCPDKDFLSRAYSSYKKNELFWCNKRRESGDILFHYDSEPDKDWLTFVKYESGLDNSIRFDRKIHELWPVDLNCFMVDFYDALAFMSNELGTDEAEIWLNKKEILSREIREKLWDSDDCTFYDTDRFTGEREKVSAPHIFMPMFSGVATKEQGEFLYKTAVDKNKFYPGIPTVSYDNPSYTPNKFWRGPTWLNLAYFTIKGLERYGYNEAAADFTATILSWIKNNPNDIYEYYHSKNGRGLGATHFGWSSAFAIELINPPTV